MSPNPLPKHTPEEVAEILSHIPPEPDYETWIKICFSVCSEIGKEDGLQVLLEWSPDYGNKSTESVIESFDANRGMTIATLIGIAQENGFDNSEFQKKRCKKYGASFSPQDYKDKPAEKARVQPLPHSLAPLSLGECSGCKTAYETQATRPFKIISILNFIKTGRWKDIVEKVRNGRLDKKELPLICAYGCYRNHRKDENLISRSGFIVLDYDQKDNIGIDFAELKKQLSKLPFVLSAFKSPSGLGLKALIRVPDNLTDSQAFDCAKEILASFGGVIDSSSGARKHFFVSYDGDAFINPNPVESIPALPTRLTESTLDSFDHIVEKFVFKGKDTYFYDDGSSYRELGKSDAMEELIYNHRIDKKTAQRILCDIRERRYVDEVRTSLTCRKKGIHILANKRVLVLQSVEYIKQKEGDFPFIRKALETIFKGENLQLWILLGWLQHAYNALTLAIENNGERITPVPLLMLLGHAGAGKDLLFSGFINPILGDRTHAAANTFAQERQWVGPIIGHECILASEMPRLNSIERDRFKSTIKQIIGGSGYFAESKGKDGFTFRGQHFICLLANTDEGGNCASACPAIDEDFKDKFVALTLKNSDEVKALFPGVKSDENSKRIRAELPAFLYWLTNKFKFPKEKKDERFGVKGYCSPDAADALFEVSPVATLKEQLLFYAEKTPELYDKSLTATEILNKLSYTWGKTYSPATLGRHMQTLCKEAPERFVFSGNRKHPAYTIRKNPQKEKTQAWSFDKALNTVSPFDEPLAATPPPPENPSSAPKVHSSPCVVGPQFAAVPPVFTAATPGATVAPPCAACPPIEPLVAPPPIEKRSPDGLPTLPSYIAELSDS